MLMRGVICSLVSAVCLNSTVSLADASSGVQWLQGEEPIALTKLLANFSEPGAAAGALTAAPSQTNPDYYFNWIRDAGISIDALLVVYENTSDASTKSRLQSLFQDYVNFAVHTQQTATQQGAGLGEPKFNLDGSVFAGPWARPQNDGPALRAIVLIGWAQILVKQGQGDYVRSTLYDGKQPTASVIKADLDYVAAHWNDVTYGPWEDESGRVLYDVLTMHKALSDGATLASSLGDGGTSANYLSQANAMMPLVNRFWNSSAGYLVDTLDQNAGITYKIGNLDSSTILGALFGDGISLGDDQMLATFSALENTFRGIYAVNQNLTAASGLGVAIGRYNGDQYNGVELGSTGNPWPLLTTSFAIFCYRLATELGGAKSIAITSANLPFYQSLPTSGVALHAGDQIAPNDPRFHALITGLQAKGDAFLATVAAHAGADGSLSEQFNKDSGYMQGAPDLSMNYAAVLLAASARRAAVSSP